MNRKKIIGIITLITLAAILLNGCGGSSAGVAAGSTNSLGSIGSSDAGNAVTASEAEPDGAKEANSEEAAVDQGTAITEAVTEEGSAVDEGSIEEQEIRSEEETEETALEAETFPETVFFDKNDIKIRVKAFRSMKMICESCISRSSITPLRKSKFGEITPLLTVMSLESMAGM